MSDKKKFGLIMPKKACTSKIKKHSVFNEDESDEDEKSYKRPKIPQKKINLKSKIKSEVVEDPSIFEYDNIYDEMKLKQVQSIAPKEKKNSRYIETLMKAADKKKKEYERRMDKKIQAEREKEGDKYKDKEAFVTSSYKRKMEELEEEEERERRENMLNDMMDVSKQKDLSGFYRHFLKQTVGEEKVPEFGERQIKKEVVDKDNSPHNLAGSFQDCKNIDQDSDGVRTDSDEDENLDRKKSNHRVLCESNIEDKGRESCSHSKFSPNLPGSSQDYRNIDQDSDGIELDSDEDEEPGNEKPSPANKRRKSDKEGTSKNGDLNISQENSDDTENQKGKQKELSSDHETKILSFQKHIQAHHRRKSSQSSKSSLSSSENELIDSIRKKKDKNECKISGKNIDKNSRRNSHSPLSNNSDNEMISDVEKKSSNEKSPKRNIYDKRTVGDIFAEAQARYFQRMAARDART